MDAKSKLSTKLSIGVGVLALAGVATWGVWPSGDPEPQAKEAPSAEGAAASSGVPKAPRAFEGRPAFDGRYELRYDLALESPAPGGGHSVAEVSLHGHLSLSPAAEDGWVAARLAVDRFELNNLAAQATDFPDAPEGELASAWLMQLDPEGRVLETRFPEGLSVATRALFSVVAAAAQVVVPADLPPGATAWSLEEQDVNAPYEASYTWDGHGGIDKRWEAAVGESSDGHAVLRASGELKVDASEGRVTSALYRHHATQRLGNARAGQRSVNFRTEVDLIRRGDADRAWAAALAPGALRPFAPENAETGLARREATGTPVDELLKLAKDAGERGDWQVRVMLRDDLTRAVKADAKIAADLEGRLRQGVGDEPTERMLIEALAGAGTPEAHQALASMVSDRANLEYLFRERILQASALIRQPSRALVTSVRELALSPSTPEEALEGSYAAITLGAMVHHLRGSDPEHAQALMSAMLEGASPILTPEVPAAGDIDPIDRRIEGPAKGKSPGQPEVETAMEALGPEGMGDVEGLGGVVLPYKPSTMQARVNWLGALGNTGLPEALPLIVGSLEDEDLPVRIAAASALRFQGGPAKYHLAKILMTSDEILVRDAAVDAARTIGPEMMQDLMVKVLEHDVSERVRLNAAFTFAHWEVDAPGLRKVMARALEAEGSPKVREALMNYLKPGRVAAPFQLVEKGDASEVLWGDGK